MLLGLSVRLAAWGGEPVVVCPPLGTVLQISFDGFNGATAATDDSDSDHALIFNGNAQIGTGTFVDGDSSLLLDGAGDTVSAADSDDWDLGAGDWTMEAWVMFAVAPGTAQQVIIGRSAASNITWRFEFFSGNLRIVGSTNGTSFNVVLGRTWTPVERKWYHVAFDRVGNDTWGYIDGVAGNNVPFSGTLFDGSASLSVGGRVNEGGFNWEGFIDMVRLNKGNGLYGGVDFIPQGQFCADCGDPRWPNVSLLLPFDGLDAATTTDDESNNQNLMTFVADAQLDTAQKKFGTASLLLDGLTDSVTTLDSLAFEFGALEFTVECHVRFNGDPGTAFMALVSKWGTATTTSDWYFGLRNNQLVMFHSIGGGVIATLAENWNPAGDTWYHIAFCRDNLATNVTRVFVDGVQLGTDNNSIDSNPTINHSASPVVIGNHTAAAPDPLDGWIDNVRVSLGVCRYDEDFTPPTEAYPSCRTGGNFGDVTFQSGFEGVNGAQVFSNDVKTKGQPVLPSSSDAATVTNDKKYGVTSMFLDGNDRSALYIDDGINYNIDDFGSGGFTIELWYKGNGTATSLDYMASRYTLSGSNSSWYFLNISDNSVTFGVGAGSGMLQNNQSQTMDDDFHHFAMSRTDGEDIVYCYIDGVASGTMTPAGAGWSMPYSATGKCVIGGWYHTNTNIGNECAGWYDDMRITKGLGRYPDGNNFTPPGEFDPNFGAPPTALLTLNDLTSTDFDTTAPYDSTVGVRLTTGGSAQERSPGGSYNSQNPGVEWIDDAGATSDEYECMLSETSASLTITGPALDVWHSLSATREWECNSTAVNGFETWNGTLQIREIATPANIVSADVAMDIENGTP